MVYLGLIYSNFMLESTIYLLTLWQGYLPSLSGCNLSGQKFLLYHRYPRRCHNNPDSIGRIFITLTLSGIGRAQRLLTNSFMQRPIRPKLIQDGSLLPLHLSPLLRFDVMNENLWKQKSVGCPSETVRGKITRVYLQMINLQAAFFFFFAECLNMDL